MSNISGERWHCFSLSISLNADGYLQLELHIIVVWLKCIREGESFLILYVFICSDMFIIPCEGSRQECLSGWVQKGWGVWWSSPQGKKIKSFKFKCLKLPILTEMTAISKIYFYFFSQQEGNTPPPCGAERWCSDPPPLPHSDRNPACKYNVYIVEIKYRILELYMLHASVRNRCMVITFTVNLCIRSILLKSSR